ncbi:MAG: ribonuclease J [Rhodospirillales bacterium]|nr:ribonuclease J [Rhodospirillales bacterium]
MVGASADLAFLPLGGTGEIGMNFNLYRCDGRWLAVDCGIGFGSGEYPEAEIMLPDPSFIASRRDALVGLVITHAHEDHLGAVPRLWRELRCPVYATPFAAAILTRKLGEAGLLSEVKIKIVAPGGGITLGPFSIEFLHVAHSTPEARAMVIRTPYGTVLHTGDWKLDPHPLIGPPTDEAAFAALGAQGVLAMVCDSTNAMVEGHSGSEADVRRTLTALIRDLPGRVAVTCFASNVARVESVAVAARAAGRSIVIAGRSLRNVEAAARECGYLKMIPPFLPEDAANEVPDERLLLLVSGSQGEPRSALSRIAADVHPRIALGEGDTVVFSSRVIPGNERAIRTVQDNLVRRGVRLMTDADHMVHVSGHPARDELRRLYRLVKPKFAVPVHGEWRHLTAHAGLAQELGIRPILLEDGEILKLVPEPPEVVDSVPVGRLVLDGNRMVPLQSEVMAVRRRMLGNGAVLGSLAVDRSGRIVGCPQVSAPGLLEMDDPEVAHLNSALAAALADLPAPLRRDDASFAEAARSALRREFGRRYGKRPVVEIHLLRVE